MKFSEMVDQASEFLRRRERVSYRALKREFDLDDESLEDLKTELIDAQRIATDEDGKILVWVGASPVSSSKFQVSSSQPPAPGLWTADPGRWTPPHLADRIRAEQTAMEARSTADGERKTITALFADLKGSTALIEGLDPEEARAIIDPALQLMMDAVHRYEGYVAQALGDGIFALFGAPIAHEDHPQRALYAALRMQDEMRRYADSLRQKGYPPLLMRVGINTGEVVVRSIRKDDLHTDYVPVGHSTNLAARMEQLANPGSIVVSAYTYRLSEGYFAFKDLGPTQIKGVEEPLNLYEVLGVGALRTRLQVAARRGLTRFVGRQREMEQLQQALEQAKTGHGQIVGVTGEPGLGKSRLFYEFKLLSLSGGLVLEAYSVSHGKATAYLPVIELLKSYFRIEPQDEERTRQEKVTGKVLRLDRSLEDTLPYLFALLGIEEQPSPLQQMDPQIRRRRTFEALKRLFLRESLNQPLILIFEDLHWLDSETQGLLDTLSESLASTKILLLVNYRPEYRQEWGQKTYYTQLRLAPLGKAEAEEFLDILLGGSGSPLPRGERDRERVRDASLQTLKQLILDKTQGTPFFMEEIVQELVEQDVLVRDGVGAGLVPARSKGAHKGTPLQIPATVQGVLAARIDRLAPEEKALLQQLAVIGREFPLSLIKHVVAQSEDELYRLLSALQHKEFLYEQPAFPESEYLFKHALTQEVAYNSVLIERRKALHEQTAQAIEQLFHDRLEEHYSELAHHYGRSGNTEKAIEYLQKAGQQAVQRSANTEAITHLTAALELLNTLPDTNERDQQELLLQLALGPALMATKGYSALEVEQAYRRVRALSDRRENNPHLFSALMGLAGFYLLQGQIQTAYELGEQLSTLAKGDTHPLLQAHARWALGTPLCWQGELVRARTHLEHGISFSDLRQDRAHIFRFAADPGVACRSFMALTLWHLGYPSQALQHGQEAVALAQALSDPHNLAAALTFTSRIHLFRGEVREAREQADAAVSLSTEQGFAQFRALGMIYQGGAFIEQDQIQEGVSLILQGLEASRTLGTGLGRSIYLTRLAEGYRKMNQVEEGLRVVSEALAIVDQKGERIHEAELYRLKGELTLQFSVQRLESRVKKSGKSKVKSGKLQVPSTQHPAPNTQAEAEAEECFQKAIEIAQRQQAKSLELRATMSLARLRQQKAAEQGAGSKEQSARSKEVRAGNTEQESRTTQHVTRTALDAARLMLAEIYHWFTEGFDTKDLQEAKALIEELSD